MKTKNINMCQRRKKRNCKKKLKKKLLKASADFKKIGKKDIKELRFGIRGDFSLLSLKAIQLQAETIR